ncbi:MAG: hypothetical protein V4736_13270 [Bdellovibrionota bacterium]
MLWFKDYYPEVFDTSEVMISFNNLSSISIFHEQNHRILWLLLPPAPAEKADFSRYLNFSESIIVTLDMVLGDQLGRKHSAAFERVKTIYQSGGHDKWSSKSPSEYRKYLSALMTATYLLLEHKLPDDIPAALNYIFPGNKKMVAAASERALDLSVMFTSNTNPQWQQKNWKQAQTKLKKIHKGSVEEPFYLCEDALDFEEEFVIANRIFDAFGI